jgi:hypothetical protein
VTLLRAYLPATVLGVWALVLIAGADPVALLAPGIAAMAVAWYFYATDVRHRLRRLERERREARGRDRWS